MPIDRETRAHFELDSDGYWWVHAVRTGKFPVSAGPFRPFEKAVAYYWDNHINMRRAVMATPFCAEVKTRTAAIREVEREEWRRALEHLRQCDSAVFMRWSFV